MKINPADEPLDLSVHSLPHPQELGGSGGTPVTGRWKLLAIFFLCSLPVAATYFAYFVVRPQGQAGFGALIDPVRPVGTLSAAALDGTVQPLAQLKGQWLLLTVGSGACAQECQQRLFLQRQLRETLGKDKERVDWVWLVSDDLPIDASMRVPLKDAVVLRVQDAVLNAWLEVPQGKAAGDYIFVIDPLGNTMMRLPSTFGAGEVAKAKRDLDRLLRASLSWDPPGR
jgi:hypothetical protein